MSSVYWGKGGLIVYTNDVQFNKNTSGGAECQGVLFCIVSEDARLGAQSCLRVDGPPMLTCCHRHYLFSLSLSSIRG